MDFYIRTFSCNGLGTPSNPITDTTSFPNVARVQSPYSFLSPPDSYYGNIYGIMFSRSMDVTTPESEIFRISVSDTIGARPYFYNPPVYAAGGYIMTHLRYSFLEANSPRYDFNGGIITEGYNRAYWQGNGWSSDPTTFENQLCDTFLTITDNGDIGDLGKIEDKMNMYLVRVYLTDIGQYEDIPYFFKGNDPAYDRIYTASLVP